MECFGEGVWGDGGGSGDWVRWKGENGSVRMEMARMGREGEEIQFGGER